MSISSFLGELLWIWTKDLNRNGATSKDLNSTNTGVPEAGIQDYGFDRAKVQFKVSGGQNI